MGQCGLLIYYISLTCHPPSLPPSLPPSPQYITLLRGNSEKNLLTIGDAVNLAILEEMVRDPTTTIHAEDLQVRQRGRGGRREGGREGEERDLNRHLHASISTYSFLPSLPPSLLQAGSSYNIPKLTQQTFGKLRAADEIIDEGHFIGKALGEAMNGYRPIVELMNTNFGTSFLPSLPPSRPPLPPSPPPSFDLFLRVSARRWSYFF